MTKEQIAVAVVSAASWGPGIEQIVRRLADEREALLNALVPIVRRLDGDREFVCPDGGAEMLVAACAAIAKAEAE